MAMFCLLPLICRVELWNVFLISLESGSVCVSTCPEVCVSAQTDSLMFLFGLKSLTWTPFSGRTPEER